MKTITEESLRSVLHAGSKKNESFRELAMLVASRLGVEAGEPIAAPASGGTVNVRAVLEWLESLPETLEGIEEKIDQIKPHLEMLSRVLGTLNQLGFVAPNPHAEDVAEEVDPPKGAEETDANFSLEAPAEEAEVDESDEKKSDENE